MALEKTTYPWSSYVMPLQRHGWDLNFIWISIESDKSFSSAFVFFFWLHFILNWWYTFINIQVYAYGSNFIGFPQRDVQWNCLGSLKVVAAVLFKDTFGVNSKFFQKLYSQNDVERIFLLPVCVAHKLITPHYKSGSYFVEKGKRLVHTRNCRNQACRSFIDLIGTTLSEDPGHCTQLCRLQLPSKMIIDIWFLFVCLFVLFFFLFFFFFFFWVFFLWRLN